MLLNTRTLPRASLGGVHSLLEISQMVLIFLNFRNLINTGLINFYSGVRVNMDNVGQIASDQFNYILLVVAIPFVLFVLTGLSYFIYPPVSSILFIITIFSLFVILGGGFLLALVFGKPIVSKRAEVQSKRGLSLNKQYFFDLIDEAKRAGWEVIEKNPYEITIKGLEKGISFEIYASYSKSWGKKKSRSENLTVNFLIKNGPTFYFTQGNLPGLFGEKIIGKNRINLNGVTPIGEETPEVVNFIVQNKSNVEYLFKEKDYLSELHFEDGQMDCVILNDMDNEGNTKIKEIIEKLAYLATNFNALF